MQIQKYVQALFLLLIFSQVAWASEERSKTALVIGNSGYAVQPLKNPINDAKAIGEQLKSLGFDVVTLFDGNQKQMQRAVQEFEGRMKKGGVSLLYYAGHGMQLDGVNYLIPVREDFKSELDVKFNAISMNMLLERLNKKESYLNMVILDACRNNPYAATSSRSLTRGLARMGSDKISPGSTLVMYATSANSIAADGDGSNGMFTKHLLRQLRTTGQEVISVFKKTMKGVKEESSGKQIPELSLQFYDDYYFSGKPLTAGPQLTPEQQFWDSIKNSQNYKDFEDYLLQFPQGNFVTLAKSKLEALLEAQGRVTGPPQKQDAIAFRFANPPGSILTIDGGTYNVTNDLMLYLEKGETKFALGMPDGRTIYGVFRVHIVDEFTKTETYGYQEVLPKQNHIDAALRGAPVFYKLGSSMNGSKRNVLNYVLSLRPF